NGVPRTAPSGRTPSGHRARPARRNPEGRARRLQRVAARPGHHAPQRTAPERGPAETPAAATHLPGRVPGAPPRSHLLRGARGRSERGDAAHTSSAARVSTFAARRGIEGGVLTRKPASSRFARYGPPDGGPYDSSS